MTNKNKLKILDIFSFLLGFQVGTTIYIMSSFLKSASGIERMEIFYLIGYATSLILLFNFFKLVKRVGKIATFKYLLILNLCSFLVLMIFHQSLFGVLGAVCYLVISSLLWVSLDILVENFTTNCRTGSTRGKFLTLMNLGIFLAPFLSAYLIGSTESYISSFGVSFFVGFLVFIIFIFFFPKKSKSDCRRRMSILKSFKKIFKNRKLSKIYYIAFLLDFFYATMTIYMPLYLLSLGVGWIDIGKIFTIMLLPFIFIQYPLGKIADKFTGEKEWLLVGIFFMALFSLLAGFISHNQIIIWAAILFFTRIGAAIVEIMRDSYFYKQVDPGDVDVIDFFRTSRSSAYIIAMIIFAPITIFLSLSNIFIILGIIVLSGIYPLFRLKDTK